MTGNGLVKKNEYWVTQFEFRKNQKRYSISV